MYLADKTKVQIWYT